MDIPDEFKKKTKRRTVHVKPCAPLETKVNFTKILWTTNVLRHTYLVVWLRHWQKSSLPTSILQTDANPSIAIAIATAAAARALELEPAAGQAEGRPRTQHARGSARESVRVTT